MITNNGMDGWKERPNTTASKQNQEYYINKSFYKSCPTASNDTFFPLKQGRERSDKLMPFIGGFARQFLSSNNSSVSEKECGLGFQKGVNHTCRGAGSLSPPLQTTFSQLLFIKLGFEIFELWLNIFKSQVKFFELPVELGFHIQISSQALGTWTKLLVKEALHLNFRYSWLSATEPAAKTAPTPKTHLSSL